VQINLSDEARNAMVGEVTTLIDGVDGNGRIELLSSSGIVLASLACSNPCAQPPVNGSVTFNTISEDPSAKASGTAVKARIVDAAGGIVFECDVSDSKGDAVIRLNTTRIVAGGPVRIREFVLVMPA
jgi:hypothetical protein